MQIGLVCMELMLVLLFKLLELWVLLFPAALARFEILMISLSFGEDALLVNKVVEPELFNVEDDDY